METEKPKIALYARRSFGEKLNATFDFLKQNYRPLFMYGVYLLLPLCLIQAFLLNFSMGNSMTSISMLMKVSMGVADNLSEDMLPNLILFVVLNTVLYVIGTALSAALIFTFFRLYQEREDGLRSVVWKDMRPLLISNFFKALGTSLMLVVFTSLIVGISVFWLVLISGYLIILLLPLILLFYFGLSLWLPAYLLKNGEGFWNAMIKSFRLTMFTFGGTLLLLFIISLLTFIFRGIFSLPYQVVVGIQGVFMLSDPEAHTNTSPILQFCIYLFSVLQNFGGYLAIFIFQTAMSFQYGHAAETMEGVTVESDIEQFDKL